MLTLSKGRAWNYSDGKGVSMEQNRILVMEDDADINRLLCTILKKNGYLADGAFSGTEGKLRLTMETYDLILLDLMLPGLSGEEFLAEIRGGKESIVPVIVISAKTALSDKVAALSLGADDYVTKPFESAEVLARVEAQLRRFKRFQPQKEKREKLEYKELSLDPDARTASVLGTPISLTAREFDLLALLIAQPEKVFTREALYARVWGGEYYGEDNTVNVHISNIRAKLAKVSPETEYVKTVWGIGFKMAEQPEH